MSNGQPPGLSTSNPLPAARVVVLGASNVTLGFPRIVASVRGLVPGPVQLFAAHGHGRSYGQPSSIPFRTLPGILDSGLWDALDRLAAEDASPAPLFALVTDIGNDLVYGNSPERIGGWIEECLSRLRARGARITIGRMPLASLQRVGRVRFQLMRTAIFPNSRLTWDGMRADAVRLDELVSELATRHQIGSIVPRPEWYGIDPIHIRRKLRSAAWRDMLQPWGLAGESDAAAPGLAASWRYWRLRPAERSVFGRVRAAAQPGWRWPDGSAIWVY
ncbi:MAG: hypothetical protein KF774_07295 [Planctomyces sp.]|nr:hypothetical protein [Planctomyces sp.]